MPPSTGRPPRMPVMLQRLQHLRHPGKLRDELVEDIPPGTAGTRRGWRTGPLPDSVPWTWHCRAASAMPSGPMTGHIDAGRQGAQGLVGADVAARPSPGGCAAHGPAGTGRSRADHGCPPSGPRCGRAACASWLWHRGHKAQIRARPRPRGSPRGCPSPTATSAPQSLGVLRMRGGNGVHPQNIHERPPSMDDPAQRLSRPPADRRSWAAGYTRRRRRLRPASDAGLPGPCGRLSRGRHAARRRCRSSRCGRC